MIKIGIICPSEIALRRFLPALSKLSDFQFVGVASADIKEWEGATDRFFVKKKKKPKHLRSDMAVKYLKAIQV